MVFFRGSGGSWKPTPVAPFLRELEAFPLPDVGSCIAMLQL
jgi:hypothetical protein